MVRDPVCGMEVDEKTTPYKSIVASNVYHFCSAKCKDEFNMHPEKYLSEKGAARHTSHYGGYCTTPGCSKPTKGLAWYLYLGLLLLMLLGLLLFAL